LGCTSETGLCFPVPHALTAEHPALRRRRPYAIRSTGVKRRLTRLCLLRFLVPLATSPLESGSPETLVPASSAHVLSQDCDGLLLQTVCLFCFVQTPPMGFKEHELFLVCLTFLTKPPWGWSRSGSVKTRTPRQPLRVSEKTITDAIGCAAPAIEPFQPDNRRCVTHQTARKRTEWEEGSPTCPILQLTISHKLHAMRRCVTHQTARKRTEWEEGSPTCPKPMNQPRVPNTITNDNGFRARTTK
jgi:hypothetical protein